MRKISKIIIFIAVIVSITFIKSGQAQAASLSLSPATATIKVGETLTVDVILDTGSDSVSGATAILRYDRTRLQVVDDDAATAGLQIAQGAIFNQTPLTNSVDTVAGTIRYDSGSLGTSYTGRGTMATIHFRALAVGTAPVTFVFDSASTTETSLVAAASGPTNLLTTVSDGSYTITTSTYVPPTPLPPSGVVENTLMMLGGAIIFIVLGIIFAL